MSRADGILCTGRAIRLDDSRRVEGYITKEGGVDFVFWNGCVLSKIRLTDEAFHAAMQIYAELQREKVQAESKNEECQ